MIIPVAPECVCTVRIIVCLHVAPHPLQTPSQYPSMQSDQRICYSLSEKESIFNSPYFGGLQRDKASGDAPELYIIIIGPRREKTCLQFLTNRDSNQPAKLWKLASKLKFR